MSYFHHLIDHTSLKNVQHDHSVQLKNVFENAVGFTSKLDNEFHMTISGIRCTAHSLLIAVVSFMFGLE